MARIQVKLPIINDRLAIKVKPGAKETKVTAVEGGLIHIDVAAPADKNKANIELLKFLKRETKRTARLVSGKTSREKVVEFEE